MPKSLRTVPILGQFVRTFQDRLTARGRYLFLTMLLLGVLGLDTRRNQVFALFAVAAGLFLVSSIFGFFPRPAVRVECRLPSRATALQPAPVHVRLAPLRRTLRRDLHVSFPLPGEFRSLVGFSPPEAFVVAGPEGTAEVNAEFRPLRRGRYELQGAAVRACDPLGLVLTRAVRAPNQQVVVYPRFYSLPEFPVPAGRRYQPGGIPLASNTGDAIEFVGTREYREGDPVKNIHWRSWARRGEPVVKEYQEEYFARIALILDTFLPARATAGNAQAFEAAISVVASIADFFSRSEYIVDILAAGPDIYEVSAGRSLAYLENILDVLACLEPCAQPPFQAIGPALFDKLAQITTVVAVLLDWDEPREAFLRRLKSLGTELRVLVIREGPTTRPWQYAAADLAETSVLTPADVERALSAST